MIQSIKKDTYVEADDKTTKAMTYDILNGLYERIDEIIKCHDRQKYECDERIKKIERGRTKEHLTAAGGGVVGGALTMLGYYIKTWFD